jgi:NDP-sugar pyrophosphorylase family protein
MQALILAGGKGTRLRPLTVYTPKPVVPVMNQPFLLYQLEILAKAGVRDITLSLNYQPDKIEDVLGDGSDYGVNLTFITEPSPLGTAGAYRYAADNIRETTIVLNGDILTDLDISALIASHKEKNAEATIVLTPVEDPSAYGLVETADDGSVLRFLEKPKPEQLKDLKVNTINAGVYVLEPSILDLIPAGENTSFEYSVFPAILEQKRRFFSYILKTNYWRDIGNPQSYLDAHHDFLHGRVKGFSRDPAGASDIATAAHVDKASALGTGCVIKPNARIINSVLGPGVHVDEKAVIENSVIWSHTRVSALAEIHNAVVGRSCHIGKSVSVGPGSVLGDKASLPDYSRV